MAHTLAFVESDADHVEIPGVTHVWQKWNNCGPSTVLMALSAVGVQREQLDVAAHIKPNQNDTNVTAEELARYAEAQGMGATVRYGLTRSTLRRLLQTGTPVMVEHWIAVEGRGEMGHYRVAIGYDDPSGQFLVQDSYYGPRRQYPYEAFEEMGRPFLGVYIPVFPPDRRQLVQAALGAEADDESMWTRVAQSYESAVLANPQDVWGWFGLGEIRARRGDDAGSVVAFERAKTIGLPFRAFWYQFGYYRALVALGRYQEAIDQADETLETMKGENLEESHYWRGVALREMGRIDEARDSFEKAIAFNPFYDAPREALAALPATAP